MIGLSLAAERRRGAGSAIPGRAGSYKCQHTQIGYNYDEDDMMIDVITSVDHDTR